MLMKFVELHHVNKKVWINNVYIAYIAKSRIFVFNLHANKLQYIICR